MSDELREGVPLKAVYGPAFPDGSFILYSTGHAGRRCQSITVRMQTGQMAAVPWAECVTLEGERIMVNLAMIESVELERLQ